MKQSANTPRGFESLRKPAPATKKVIKQPVVPSKAGRPVQATKRGY